MTPTGGYSALSCSISLLALCRLLKALNPTIYTILTAFYTYLLIVIAYGIAFYLDQGILPDRNQTTIETSGP